MEPEQLLWGDSHRQNGVGNHEIKTIHERMTLNSVNVVNNGSGYTYRQRSLYPVGVNTSNNVITIKKHGYESGETVRYSLGEGATEMQGISSNTDYVLTKLDDDNFKPNPEKSEKSFFEKVKDMFS